MKSRLEGSIGDFVFMESPKVVLSFKKAEKTVKVKGHKTKSGVYVKPHQRKVKGGKGADKSDKISEWIENEINPVQNKMYDLEVIFNDIEENMDREEGLKYYHALISHSSREVRGSLIHYLDDDGRRKLMNDSNDDVRQAIAFYTNDPETIQHLVKDKNDIIRTQAYKKYYITLLSPLSEDFLSGKDINFGNVIEDAIKNVSFEDRDNVKYLHDGLDALFSSKSDYLEFNNYTKEEWLQSSNNLGSGLLKYCITEIYNDTEMRHHDAIELNNLKDYVLDNAKSIPKFEMNEDEMKNYVKLQKKLTKELLDIRFPDKDTFTVYRGTSAKEIGGNDIKVGDEVDILQNPLSSWTLRKDTAENFGEKENGIVIEMEISKDDIWSSFLTHSYSTFEQEMIVIGKKGKKGKITNVSRLQAKSEKSKEKKENPERFSEV